jgi:hypothetical protein
MNKSRFREASMLAVVGMLAVGDLGHALAQTESLLPSTILRLSGPARCSTDGGKSWRMVKAGDALDSGAMIQTSKKSELDLALGGRAENQPDQLVTLAEDTLLKIEKVAGKRMVGSQETVEEISLDLRTGDLAASVRRLSGGSRYEITFAKGIAGLKEGSYHLRASGELGVLKGKGYVALTDGRPAKEVGEGQQFNPATGTVTALAPPPSISPSERQPTVAASQETTAKPDAPERKPVPAKRKVQAPSTGLRRAAP